MIAAQFAGRSPWKIPNTGYRSEAQYILWVSVTPQARQCELTVNLNAGNKISPMTEDWGQRAGALCCVQALGRKSR